mgnify:CR=1 FL=1
MPKNSSRSRNNNPTRRNQYSSDWMDTIRERPIAAAAVAAASVGAGVFLWSKRNALSTGTYFTQTTIRMPLPSPHLARIENAVRVEERLYALHER